MKALLVEDDLDKSRKIEEWLIDGYPSCELTTVMSFSPALDALIDMKPGFDVVLLDMSMPNFEGALYDADGDPPETFAGRDLLAQMKLRNIAVPTIVVTMFDNFGEKEGRVSAQDLTAELKRDYPDSFRGLVYYSQAQDTWRTSLRKLVDGILK